MLVPRLLTALLAPAGVIAAHAFAYSAAHGWEHERQAMLTGHGPLAMLAAAALPLLFVALLTLMATTRESGRPGWRQLTTTQLGLLVVVELVERTMGVSSLAEFLHDPAVWLAVAGQLATAALLVWLTRCTDRLIEGCLPPANPRFIDGPTSAWQPARLGRRAASTVLSAIQRRGPPAVVACPIRS